MSIKDPVEDAHKAAEKVIEMIHDQYIKTDSMEYIFIFGCHLLSLLLSAFVSSIIKQEYKERKKELLNKIYTIACLRLDLETLISEKEKINETSH